MFTQRSTRRNILDTLVNKRILTPEGKLSLIKATDPFHDLETSICGIPDGLPEKSIVREVKKTVTVSSPLADKTQPWDLHIYTLPERNTFVNGPETNTNTVIASGLLTQAGQFNIHADALNAEAFAPLVFVAVPAGEATTPASSAWPPAGSVVIGVLDFNDYYYGQSREIYSAFEVHNVTNKLNVGGTVTTYRLPQFTYESYGSVYDITAGHADNVTGSRVVVSRMPPGDAGSALLLAGSRQWEAEFGCYCVETFDHELNRPQAGSSGIRALVSGDTLGGDSLSNLPASIAFIPDAIAGGLSNQPNFKPVRKDTSGAYFTGLPGPSQLTITVKKGIETFPSFTDPLVTLARDTPDRDDGFFELYKRISQELPSGVAVGENASGDFWDSILGLVGDIAPTVGAAFGPAGAAIGSAVGGLAKMGKAVKDKPKEDMSEFKGGKAESPAQQKAIKKPVMKKK